MKKKIKLVGLLIAVMLVLSCMTVIGCADKKTSNYSDTEISNETEPAKEIDFSFSGNTVTGYSGSDTEVVIPSSYSIKSVVGGEPVTEYTITEDDIEDNYILATKLYGLITLKNFYLTSNNHERTQYADFADFNENVLQCAESDPEELASCLVAFANDEAPIKVEGDMIFDITLEDIDTYGAAIVLPALVTTDMNGGLYFTGTGYERTYYTAIDLFEMLSVLNFETGELGEDFLATLPCRFEWVTKPEVVVVEGNDYEVTRIATGAFMDRTDITSIVIPNGVTNIGSEAFFGCTGLTSVTLGSGVTSIGDYAFCDCSGLTSIVIPDSVTSIGADAFYGCYKLVEVYNLSSLEITKGASSNGYVGYYALDIYTSKEAESKLVQDNGYIFYEDSENSIYYLMGYTGTDTDLTLPNKEYNYGIYQYAFASCDGLTSIVIPENVTSIGDSAFYGCSGLTGELVIPDSVTSIGGYAFYGCSGLTSVTLGSGVTSIGSRAFYGCSGLTSVTLGSGVTSIGKSAFSDCSNLTSVTFENTSNWRYVYYGPYETSERSISDTDLANTSTAATYLKSTYSDYEWKRS